MKGMRIVVATPLYPPEPGGPATYAKLLEDTLPARGVEVEVVKFSDVRRYPRAFRHLAYGLRVFRAARRADAVFVQDTVSCGLPALLAARAARVPCIVRVPGDYAWEQGTQRFGVTDGIDAFQQQRYGVRVELLRRIQRFVVRGASIVIVPSGYFKKIVSGWGVMPERLHAIYNGIRLPLPSKAPAGTIPHPLIVSAGRLVPWKGFDGLITLIARMPAWHLVIMGDGPERAALEERARALSISDRVRFTGTLSRDELIGWYRAADAFVLNTSFESFSFQIVEAMAAGVPVIATRVGSIPELITDGVEGVLIEPDDLSGLATALEQVMKEPGTVQRRVAAARDKVRAFTIEKTTEALVAVLSGLHAARPGRPSSDPSRLKALFISNDASLFDSSSTAHARMREYASEMKELHILSRAPEGTQAYEKGGLYLHPINGTSFFGLAALAWRARALIRARGIGVVSAQDPFEHGLAGLLAVIGTSARLHVQIHTDFRSPYFASESFLNRTRVIIAGLVLRCAYGVRVVSARIKRSVIARYGARVPEPAVIPITFPHGEPEAVPLPPNPFMFSLITASRLEPEKRIEDILAALVLVRRNYPNVGLFILGDGSRRSFLTQRVAELGLSGTVSFLGARSDARGLMKNAHAYIGASAYEGYGLALLEAALAGIPIVSTDVGIIGDVLVPESDALVCSVGDVEGLARNITRLIESGELRATLSRNARAHAVAQVTTYANQPELIVRDLAATLHTGYY